MCQWRNGVIQSYFPVIFLEKKCTLFEINCYLLTDKNISRADTSAILDNTASHTNMHFIIKRKSVTHYIKTRTGYKQDHKAT